MSELDSGMWDREYPTEEEIENPQDGMYEDDGDLYEFDSEEEEEEYYKEFGDLEDIDLEDEVSFMDSARDRLEQARLYEMLIKHDLFDGVDAEPVVVAEVQNEIKAFIMERMEILLGMKAEKTTEVHQIVAESQFNDLEVQVLRRLASKVSKGMTEEAPTSAPVEREVQSELNTVKKKAPQKGLNALSSKKTVKAPKPTAPKKKAKPQSKPLRQKTKKGVKKTKKLKADMAEVSTGGQSLDVVAKKDIKYLESLKKMSLEDANEVDININIIRQP